MLHGGRVVLNFRTISQIFSQIKKGVLILLTGITILFLLVAFREYTQWDYMKNMFKLTEEEVESKGQLIRNLGYLSISALLIVIWGFYHIFSSLSNLIEHIDYDSIESDETL